MHDRCSGTLIVARRRELLLTRYLHVVFHTPQPLGATGSAEQEDPLRSPVPHQCRHPSGSRSRSETPRRRDWLLQCVAYLEPTTNSIPHCLLCRSGLRLSPHHTRWIRSRDNYFLPKKVLQKVFRGKFVNALQQAFQNGQLIFEGDLKLLAQPNLFAAWLRPLYRQDWVVHLKRPSVAPEYVLHIWAAYTYRVAISNHRLVSFADGQVTFRGDSADYNKQKPSPLSVDEFLCRFLLHILPQGFVRIRNFGFLANRRRKTLLPLCFQLLGSAQESQAEQHRSSTKTCPVLPRLAVAGRLAAGVKVPRGGPMKVERLTAAETQLALRRWSPPQHELTLCNSRSSRVPGTDRNSSALHRTDLFDQRLPSRFSRYFVAAANTWPRPVGCCAPWHSLRAPQHRSFPPLNLHSARVRRRAATSKMAFNRTRAEQLCLVGIRKNARPIKR